MTKLAFYDFNLVSFKTSKITLEPYFNFSRAIFYARNITFQHRV